MIRNESISSITPQTINTSLSQMLDFTQDRRNQAEAESHDLSGKSRPPARVPRFGEPASVTCTDCSCWVKLREATNPGKAVWPPNGRQEHT